MRLLFLSLLLPVLVSFQKPSRLKHSRSFYIDIPEPSDVCLKPQKDGYYIVSDNGLLFETDLNWKVIRKADYQGYDFEGVYADAQYVYALEERSRQIVFFNPNTFKKVKSVEIPYAGGRNKGFESLTWNQRKMCFVSITEKDPTTLFEFDENFRQIAQYDFKIASDISAAQYHEGKLYLLSDEDRSIFRLNAETYELENSWKLNILNPEGLVFGPDGTLFVISDDLEKVYQFENTLP
jgi:uncharacterized protein YjiK